MVGTDIFIVNNDTLLCIVDYYSKFMVVKKVESMSYEEVILATKVIFAEFGLHKTIVSDVGTNFVLEWFKEY